jgi:hypothetical protein
VHWRFHLPAGKHLLTPEIEKRLKDNLRTVIIILAPNVWRNIIYDIKKDGYNYDHLGYHDVASSSSSSGATVHDEPWPLLRLLPAIVKSFSTVKVFTGWGRQHHAQPPTLRARVSLFVWIIIFDMSGLGDPTSSYATAGIVLRII